ncbi:MAG: hypothetical protein M3341_03880, partial [Actinomycetota bacterium]|nr:hypothetical protein [Actinomycetota bacterium]
GAHPPREGVALGRQPRSFPPPGGRPGPKTLEEAHDLARRLGTAIREEYPRILKVNSHIEVAVPDPEEKRETTAGHPEVVAKMERAVLETGVEARAHEVRLYSPGAPGADDGSMDAVVHLDFPPSIDMGEVHRRTELIEQVLRMWVPELEHVVIHTEPREDA